MEELWLRYELAKRGRDAFVRYERCTGELARRVEEALLRPACQSAINHYYYMIRVGAPGWAVARVEAAVRRLCGVDPALARECAGGGVE